MRTLQDLLPEISRLRSREAVRWTNGFRTIVSSYADLYGLIGAALSYFDANEVRKGDRILIWAENRAEWVAVFWACVARGVEAVPVDFRFSTELVQRIRSESRPRLVVDTAVLDLIAALPRKPSFQMTDARPDDVVEIVYTSGTTGEPKGVVHRHRNICANLRPFKSEIDKYKQWSLPFRPVRLLDLLPLSHMFGQSLGIFIPVLLGGAAAFTPELHSGKLMEIVREHRITAVVTVPKILDNLKNEVARRFKLTNAPRSVVMRIWRSRKVHHAFGWKFWAFVVGGARVDPELEEFWGRRGFLVVQGYGLTEASPVVAVNHPFNAKRGSLGKVVPGQDVMIAPDGEILVRGESVTTDDGGWLHTGDLGNIDADGRLYYRGRKKDVIVTAEGLNVFPQDIEAVLGAFPQIQGSAVIGIPSNGSEQVHAAIILNDTAADVQSIVARANEKLEAHQRIKGWSVWPDPDFPRTPSTMKVKRGEIAARIVAGTAAAADAPQNKVDLAAMSSLERVELLAELECRYQIEFNEEEFSNLKNSRELDEWIHRATQRQGGPAAPRAQSVAMPPRWPRFFPVRWFRTAFQHLASIPLFKHYLPLTVTGLENLQDLPPQVIFAANHTSHLDTPAVFAALPFSWRMRLAPAMRQSVSRFEYFLASVLFNAYPLPQEMSGARRALNYTGELVKRGYCPLVFPEGARTRDGALHPFRPGIGVMAMQFRVPIVPVCIEGLYQLYSIRDSWPKRGPVRVAIGSALVFTTESHEEIADHVRRAVEELCRAGTVLRPIPL